MAEYVYEKVGDFTYSVPVDQKPRKKQPPFVVVMNENCTSCAGSPVCMTECPVDCIHIMYDEGRPARVYVDNSICIGCMNCFSYEKRPKDVMKGDKAANCHDLNEQDLRTRAGVCPWDAIEILPFDTGTERSKKFYDQPKEALDGAGASAEEATAKK